MPATLAWSVVVPAKGRLGAKSRLGAALDAPARGALALAFLADTLTAALAAEGVARVIVVSEDAQLADVVARDERMLLEPERGPHGLLAAVRRGLARARAEDPEAGRAVLLGDLPALRPEELALALAAAAEHPLAFVADADGTGTSLAAARPGEAFAPAFGPGSAAAHAALGHAPLGGGLPGLRRDVDTPADLEAAIGLGVGPATAAALAELGRGR